MEEIGLRHLAYIGDAVWELFVRERTVYKTANSGKLHKITTQKVNCEFQAKLLEKLDEVLTEEEHNIARRARNLPIPVARRSNQSIYRQATAFETLIGLWYRQDKNRLNDVLQKLEDEVQ